MTKTNQIVILHDIILEQKSIGLDKKELKGKLMVWRTKM
jgi:hypothetical protein